MDTGKLKEKITKIINSSKSNDKVELLASITELCDQRSLVGGDLKKEIRTRTPKLRDIAFACTDYFEVEHTFIISRTRKAQSVFARHVYCYVSRGFCYSFREIGDYINRKHSTVTHSCRVVKNEPPLMKAANSIFNDFLG